MKVLYNLGEAVGHFPHMAPYFKKFGGVLFVHKEIYAKQAKNIYGDIPIITDIKKAIDYDPDLVIYADYYPILTFLKKAKHVMVFHAMEFKGYFAIKKWWNICEKFDLCLLYGDRILKEFKDNDFNLKYKIIGYPRFDDIYKTKNAFCNDRKTVLIAPTWSDESLLHKFTDSILALSKKYNVIVKPHNHSLLNSRDNNKENLQKLIKAQNENLLVYTNPDILPLMVIADLMVTDYSGCSAEFMNFDKPVVIAAPDALPVATQKRPDIWNVFKVCENPEELTGFIESQFENDDMKDERNKYFKNLVYQEEDSTATERGVKAIMKLVGEKE